MALRTYWSEIAPDILAEILPLARGSYQRDLLLGRENLSGSTLKGRARQWGARYHAHRMALLARLRAAGFAVSERRAEHGARILVVEWGPVRALLPQSIERSR